MLSSVSLLLLLSFGAGVGGILLLLRFDDLEPKFFRVNGIIASVLLVAAFFLSGMRAWGIAGAAALFFVYSATALWLPVGFERGLLLIGTLWGWQELGRVLPRTIDAISIASGGLLMASALVAMNVGHWYLSATKLSIRPLNTATIAVMGLIAMRAAWLMVVLPLSGSDFRGLFDFDHMILGVSFLARILFGILGPAVLSWMTWKTVQIQSTQSATGILYPLLALVLVGEGCAFFLTLQTSMPF
jgi:hypothetical protein